jgi:hypothetical protein
MTDEELIAMFRATGDYQNAAIADRIAALRARVAELEQKLAAIRREAKTNQKWAFLEWRDRAERAEAENARLRENSRDLWTATTALLAWVDAVPSEALRAIAILPELLALAAAVEELHAVKNGDDIVGLYVRIDAAYARVSAALSALLAERAKESK